MDWAARILEAAQEAVEMALLVMGSFSAAAIAFLAWFEIALFRDKSTPLFAYHIEFTVIDSPPEEVEGEEPPCAWASAA